MNLMKVLAIGVTVGGVVLTTAHEKVDAVEWTPRSVEAIKADVAKSNGNYTIVDGDYLWGISQATNITVQKLADMNKIADVDLIYVGNKLIFDGNIATVQNSKGETVTQSVIQNEDKVVSDQPVGKPVQDTTSNHTNKSTTPSIDNTVVGNIQNVDQTTGNTGSTTQSTPENNGSTTQIPTQPDNNQTGSTGGNIGGGQTTPSNSNNNGGNIGSSTTDTTNPSEPVKKKYTVWIDFLNAQDEAKYGIKEGQHIFDTKEEASTWIDNYANNLSKQGIGVVGYGTEFWEVQ